MLHDTIIARASAPGSAIRGILRISGPHAFSAVKKIVESPNPLALPQHSSCADVRITLAVFPSFPARLLLWQAGHSYTGDETVEIHTIGSPILLDAIMAALLSATEGVRLASPGEFTLRAFLSGRLDLAQAEAVLGIIDAASDTDLKTALYQLAGNVAAPLSAVRTLLYETLTQLEASLDFAEEEIPAISTQELHRTLNEALEQIESLRHQTTDRGLAEGKPKIVLSGLPNVGKSTLFNKLVQKDAALVSPLAGTTRDYLEAEIDWEGMPVVLIDTAGIPDGRRQTADGRMLGELDECAQIKAQELLKQVDVVIHCYEDLTGHLAGIPAQSFLAKTVFFQTKTADDNVKPLLREVGTLLRNLPAYGMLPNTALRCRESLLAAEESLCRAQTLTDVSLIALELRNAVNQLGLIDGTVHTEDILENIFSRFCIGK